MVSNSNSGIKTSPLKMLSVFSGAGGLDIGLEAAGFHSIGHIENSSACREALSLNRPDWRPLPWHDIHDAAKKCDPEYFGLQRGELDLLAGAPPCQPFSTAAQWANSARRGLMDERANTFHSFLALAGKFLPSVILIENVPSFWSASFGVRELVDKFFEDLQKSTGCSYTVSHRILNAADYGVPQQRKRFILIAHRTAKKWEWPVARYATEPRTAWDALHSITPSEIPEAKGKWAGLLPTIPPGWNYLWHSSAGRGDEIFGSRTRFWSFLLKLSPNLPSWTIAAQPGPSTGPFHWDSRPLAIEELLALQTFPKTWKLAGNHRDRVKMIGNATPPLLGEQLGRAIIRKLFSLEVPKRLNFLPKKAAILSAKTSVEKVPEKYKKLIARRAGHPGTGKGPNPRSISNHAPSEPQIQSRR